MSSPFSKVLFRQRKLSFSNRPNRQYLSRNRYNGKYKQSRDEYQLFTPVAFTFGILFLLAPISYVYIGMVVIRELFGEYLLSFSQAYAPLLHQWTLASAISNLQPPKMPHDVIVPQYDDGLNATVASYTIPNVLDSSAERTPRMWLWLWIEVWCYLEALFFIFIKLRIHLLRNTDPLEASLRAAPIMDLAERKQLWRRMQECEDGNFVHFVSGWFFDRDCNEISAYDVRDFVAWSMFEGRHQEHLTENELEQMEDFVDELEYRISLEMFGAVENDNCDHDDDTAETEAEGGSDTAPAEWKLGLSRPREFFQFQAGHIHDEEENFFTDLFESYRRRYDSIDFHPVQGLKDIMQKATGDAFHPVQDLRNLVAETAQTIADAEPVVAASQKASQLYESIVPSGSFVDKRLNATYEQMNQAWNSVKAMNDQRRLETARFISKQRQRLQQQMAGYRVMLNRMMEMSSGVPSKQMASLMRRITDCYAAMESLEGRAEAAFVQLTGFAMKNVPLISQGKEAHKFAKYSSDPIVNVSTFPLCLHIGIIGGTEIPLRHMMNKRGFRRKRIGSTTYYYHPGLDCVDMEDEDLSENEKLPIVFVHGIGIGLIVYISLVDKLLQSGRPIYLPEIPYVSGFRPWQSATGVLPPAVVTSTMVAMLATHGHLSAAWLGHSYGTSWLSYMTKYAPEAVSALLFLDPICFNLHQPRLTKSFVYTMADIGSVSYTLRTDAVVRHTIQRSFPWSRIILFTEDIHVPCHVFLSSEDRLVPSGEVRNYLRKRKVPVSDMSDVRERLLTLGNCDNSDGDLFDSDNGQHIQCIMMQGDGHGDWTEDPAYYCPVISYAAETLSRTAESNTKLKTS